MQCTLWCGTWNNYPADWETTMKTFTTEQDAYAVCGLETAPTTGTQHIQLFLYRKLKLSMRQLVKALPNIHFEKCKGTLEQNFDYCTKEGNYKEFNIDKKPQPTGKRKDYVNIPELMKTKTVKELVLDGSITNGSALKFAEGLRSYVMEPYVGPKKVIYNWGVSGSGKTYSCLKASPKLRKVRLEADGKLTNYNGEEEILIDEIESLSMAQFKELLQILDVYAHDVRVLYGTIPLKAHTIYMTSSTNPTDIVPPDQNPEQLLRRITKVNYFAKKFLA